MLDVTPAFRVRSRLRRWRHATTSPAALQQRLLRRLVLHAAATRFGKAHGLARIRGIDDYQRAVPLRAHEAFWQEFWRSTFPVIENCTWPGRVARLAMTSGTTTGRSRYVPYSRAMQAAGRRGMADLLGYHLQARAQSRVLAGRALVLAGSTRLESLAPGVKAGAVSALAASGLPSWLRHRWLPPPDIAAIEDWSRKIALLAPRSLAADVRALGGSPNWLLLFLDAVARCDEAEQDGSKLADWYPNLELIVHGGIDFDPYRRRFEILLAGGHAETREVYSASEGLFAVADRGPGEGLRLLADVGVFFEFVPVGELNASVPTRHWLASIEPGVDYAVVVTTAAGLWAYILGDTVRFLSREPPRLFVTGRTDDLLSVFGEHLLAREVAAGVAAAASAIGSDVVDFTIAPAPSSVVDRRHLLIVELTPQPDMSRTRRFAAVLDATLQSLNADYRELREGDLGLRAPRVIVAEPGGFLRWMVARRGLGGQHKVPRTVKDRQLLRDLLTFVTPSEPKGAA